MDSIYWLTSLSNFKSHINKSNTTNDNILEMYIAAASEFIESYTKRLLKVRQYGTGGIDSEYRSGDGKSVLYTKQFPIISVESLYDDPDRNYTSTYLKSSSEYIIWKDEGMIELYSDAAHGSIFEKSQNNIKLSYTAGYGTFEVITGKNDTISFTDDGGNVEATITAGVYTADGLASILQSKMRAAGTDNVVVVYNDQIHKFEFSSPGSTFQLNWTDSDISSKNIGKLLGFNILSDDTGSLSYTADKSVLGIPNDIELACILISLRMYNQSGLGVNRFDKVSQSVSIEKGGGTTKFSEKELPIGVKLILNKYRRIST